MVRFAGFIQRATVKSPVPNWREVASATLRYCELAAANVNPLAIFPAAVVGPPVRVAVLAGALPDVSGVVVPPVIVSSGQYATRPVDSDWRRSRDNGGQAIEVPTSTPRSRDPRRMERIRRDMEHRTRFIIQPPGHGLPFPEYTSEMGDSEKK